MRLRTLHTWKIDVDVFENGHDPAQIATPFTETAGLCSGVPRDELATAVPALEEGNKREGCSLIDCLLIIQG